MVTEYTLGLAKVKNILAHSEAIKKKKNSRCSCFMQQLWSRNWRLNTKQNVSTCIFFFILFIFVCVSLPVFGPNVINEHFIF